MSDDRERRYAEMPINEVFDELVSWSNQACLTGDCPHEKGADCYYDVHEAAEEMAMIGARLRQQVERLRDKVAWQDEIIRAARADEREGGEDA